MRVLAICIGGALVGCAGRTTSSPQDGGAAEASGPLDATADRVDGGSDALDATSAEASTTDTGPDAPEVQLGVPTFVPPSGVVDDEVGVQIQAPAGFPANGQILFTMNGESPVTAGNLYTASLDVDKEAYSTATVMAIARAPGFLDSPVVSADFAFETCCLEPPTFGQQSTSRLRPFSITLSDTPGVNICYTLDGTMPSCQANGSCGGPPTSTYTGSLTIDAAITGPGGTVTVTATACVSGGLHDIGEGFPVSETFGLFLAPPYLASQNGAGAGLPGWTWSSDGSPLTTMTIPADAGAPYGPFVAQQVGAPPCTGSSACTGTPLPLADFLCWSTTGPATCGCPTPLPITAATPYATLPALADVIPGGTLSVIACQSATPVNTTGYYEPSSVTTVQF